MFIDILAPLILLINSDKAGYDQTLQDLKKCGIKVLREDLCIAFNLLSAFSAEVNN